MIRCVCVWTRCAGCWAARHGMSARLFKVIISKPNGTEHGTCWCGLNTIHHFGGILAHVIGDFSHLKIPYFILFVRWYRTIRCYEAVRYSRHSSAHHQGIYGGAYINAIITKSGPFSTGLYTLVLF